MTWYATHVHLGSPFWFLLVHRERRLRQGCAVVGRWYAGAGCRAVDRTDEGSGCHAACLKLGDGW